jgi:hypothetical protein
MPIEIIKDNTSIKIAQKKIHIIELVKIPFASSKKYFNDLKDRHQRLRKHVNFLSENV